MPRISKKLHERVVLIKGGGEMATGVAHRLTRSGFRVCLTEIPQPMAVRREVAFCEAIFEGEKAVEGITGRRVVGMEGVGKAWKAGEVAVVIDPECQTARALAPDILVDAILAKRNCGTQMSDAPLVIGLGPGFIAGKDAHFVIETNRGHHLGKVIAAGEAEADTGVPGEIGGYTWQRVLRAPASGIFKGMKRIGDRIEEGEIAGEVEGVPVCAEITGVLRGILRDGLQVQRDMKAGDIDPRGNRDHCFTISEKARAIGGGVLEAILMKYNK